MKKLYYYQNFCKYLLKQIFYLQDTTSFLICQVYLNFSMVNFDEYKNDRFRLGDRPFYSLLIIRGLEYPAIHADNWQGILFFSSAD